MRYARNHVRAAPTGDQRIDGMAMKMSTTAKRPWNNPPERTIFVV